MRAAAPGKLLLTGAYVVLEGAPAVVMAVDRHAVADASLEDPSPSDEVRAALGPKAPRVDKSALYDGPNKLGLGSSAAVLVASLGAIALARGEDLRQPSVRGSIFRRARFAHAHVQGGGSGVDVAASVFGGVLRYALRRAAEPDIVPRALPQGLHLASFFCGQSARTSELRARVDALAQPSRAACFTALASAAERASLAIDRGDLASFVDAARATSAGLDALGQAAKAPIHLPSVRALVPFAEAEGAAFLPSGAGGGDIAIFLGLAPPSESFLSQVLAFGLAPLELRIDTAGVRAAPIVP